MMMTVLICFAYNFTSLMQVVFHVALSFQLKMSRA